MTVAASGPPSGTANANRPSPAAEGGYPLAGVSDLPDPDFHAYRDDLADVSLAGRVIASHYAEPLLRLVLTPVQLRRLADPDSDIVAKLEPGDEFWMLDDTGGRAWGYGGSNRLVGYIRSEALAF